MYPLNTVSHCAIVSESTTRSSNDTCISSAGSEQAAHREAGRDMLERMVLNHTFAVMTVEILYCDANGSLVSTGIATSRPEPTAMIAHCGGLMTALNSLMPNIPRFDTLKAETQGTCKISIRWGPRLSTQRNIISFSVVCENATFPYFVYCKAGELPVGSNT